MPLVPLLEHKNADFVLEKPKNRGSRPQKRTKTSILCSKSPKTGVPNPKSAQKCRFCAREGWQEGLGAAAGQRKATSGSGEAVADHRKAASGRRKRAANHQKEASGRANAHKFVNFEVGQVKAVLGCNEKMFLL